MNSSFQTSHFHKAMTLMQNFNFTRLEKRNSKIDGKMTVSDQKATFGDAASFNHRISKQFG